MKKLIKSVVIDDERIARDGIASYINRIPFMELKGSYSSVFEFLEAKEMNAVELLFLDIEMPGINGNDFLKNYTNPPLTIFVTAYPEYALEGYELNILDYLLKPVKFDRFFQACQKAQDYYFPSAQTKKTATWVKADHTLYKLLFDDIVYVNSMQNYIQIHTVKKTYTILSPLKEFVAQLPVHFIQCHKSFVINKNHIISIEGNIVYLTKGEATISRSFISYFFEHIVF
jgi:DNA-binding LytR/AlgR family response regulator